MPILKNRPNLRTQNDLKEAQNITKNGNQNRITRLNKPIQRVTRTFDVSDSVWVILCDYAENLKNLQITTGILQRK